MAIEWHPNTQEKNWRVTTSLPSLLRAQLETFASQNGISVWEASRRLLTEAINSKAIDPSPSDRDRFGAFEEIAQPSNLYLHPRGSTSIAPRNFGLSEYLGLNTLRTADTAVKSVPIEVAILSFTLPDRVIKIDARLEKHARRLIQPILKELERDLAQRLAQQYGHNIRRSDIRIKGGTAHLGSLVYKDGKLTISTKAIAIIAGAYGILGSYSDVRSGIFDLQKDIRSIISIAIESLEAFDISVHTADPDILALTMEPLIRNDLIGTEDPKRLSISHTD